MPTPHVILDFQLTVNAVNLTAWLKGLELSDTFSEIDDSTMGSSTKVSIAGAEEWQLTADLEQDYTAGGPFATLWPLRGTVVPIKVRPHLPAAGPDNPSFEGDGLISEFKPIGGNWNEKHLTRLVVKSAGPLTAVGPVLLEAASSERPGAAPAA